MTDVPNKHIGFAHVLLVYVGLAQARPNNTSLYKDFGLELSAIRVTINYHK